MTIKTAEKSKITAQNSLKHLTLTVHGLINYSGGLFIGSIFASEIWGAYFRSSHFDHHGTRLV